MQERKAATKPEHLMVKPNGSRILLANASCKKPASLAPLLPERLHMCTLNHAGGEAGPRGVVGGPVGLLETPQIPWQKAPNSGRANAMRAADVFGACSSPAGPRGGRGNESKQCIERFHGGRGGEARARI